MGGQYGSDALYFISAVFMLIDPFTNFLFGICLVLFVTGVRQRTSGTDTPYVSANLSVVEVWFSLVL